jgi:hypothetical protein
MNWLTGSLRVIVVCAASLLFAVQTAYGDSAPIWESPVGLVPGDPNTRVQMRSERVDIRVEERDGAAFAVVKAEFELVNPGEPESLKVGFPNWTYSLIADLQGLEAPFSPVVFSPDALTQFRAWTETAEYQPTVQLLRVRPDDSYGSEWFVWDMSIPTDGPTALHVSYEQRLSWEMENVAPYVQPMYVLRTGALWAGPIGEATITMSTSAGGVFLGGPEIFARQNEAGEIETLPSAGSFLGLNQASEMTPNTVVWRLRDLEPTQDLGTTYVFESVWRPLVEGERRIAEGSATPEEYLRSVEVATRLLGRWGPGGVPIALLDRFPPSSVRDWARASVQRAPNSADAWVALGDTELWFAFPLREYQGEIACWPTSSVEAYERASALGSAIAVERLADLDLLREHQVLNDLPDPPPCP